MTDILSKILFILIIIMMIIDLWVIVYVDNSLGRFTAAISLMGFSSSLVFEYIKIKLFK